MPKYLIQDIIPPEKKRRSTKTKKPGGESLAHPSERNAQAEMRAEEEQAITHPEHPIRIRKGTPVTRAPISEAFPENPRRMLVDQIANDESLSGMTEKNREESGESFRRTANMLTPEKKVWSYDLHSEEGQSISPPPVVPPAKPVQFPEYAPMESSGGRSQIRTWLPWLAGVVIILVVGVLVLNFFAGATVTIVTKHETLPMDEKFTALKNGTANDLPYAIMSTTTSLSLEVPATGEKTVTTKASGKIVVYNEQTSSQRLIKNTRFQSPSGKIYRINDSITVPKATVSGGKTTPGALEVTVYADEAGPAYNSDPVDFTLPGLKSSTLFTKVYARSKGALTGGASGTIKTVSDQDLKQAGEDLRIQLETKLRSTARGALAPFQIAYDQGIVVELGQPVLSKTAASAENKAVVTEEGKIVLVLFKRADLIKIIFGKLVENYAGEEVNIKNLDSLQFAMNTQSAGALQGATKLDFTLKGTPELTWVIDEALVKKALIGISKESFNSILAQFPAVERAEAKVHPMWKRAFPDDPSRITFVISDSLSK